MSCKNLKLSLTIWDRGSKNSKTSIFNDTVVLKQDIEGQCVGNGK